MPVLVELNLDELGNLPATPPEHLCHAPPPPDPTSQPMGLVAAHYPGHDVSECSRAASFRSRLPPVDDWSTIVHLVATARSLTTKWPVLLQDLAPPSPLDARWFTPVQVGSVVFIPATAEAVVKDDDEEGWEEVASCKRCASRCPLRLSKPRANGS